MIDTFSIETRKGKPNMEDSEWILTDVAAGIMKVSPDMVQKLCRQYRDTEGKEGIKSRKMGRDWFVSRQAAESYEGRNKKKSEK